MNIYFGINNWEYLFDKLSAPWCCLSHRNISTKTQIIKQADKLFRGCPWECPIIHKNYGVYLNAEKAKQLNRLSPLHCSTTPYSSYCNYGHLGQSPQLNQPSHLTALPSTTQTSKAWEREWERKRNREREERVRIILFTPIHIQTLLQQRDHLFLFFICLLFRLSRRIRFFFHLPRISCLENMPPLPDHSF